MKLASKKNIRISAQEYAQFKQLQKYVAGFLGYAEHIRDIVQARQEVKAKKLFLKRNFFASLVCVGSSSFPMIRGGVFHNKYGI